MDRNSSTSSSDTPRQWPVAALLAILVIVGIEGLVVLNRPIFRSAPAVISDEKRAILTDSNHVEDAVIYGDSRMFSMRPALVADALGTSLGPNPQVTNYAWYFSGMEAYELMLRAHLDHKPPPELIIFSLMPEFLVLPHEEASMATTPAYRPRIYNIIPSGSLWKSFFANGDTVNLWHYLTYNLTPPTTRYRERVTQGAARLLRGKDPASRLKVVTQRLQTFRTEGALILFGNQEASPEECVWFQHSQGPSLEKGLPPAMASFERFLGLARDNDIDLLLVNPPIPHLLYGQYEHLGVPEEFEVFLAELEREYSNLHITEPHLYKLPTDHFGDIYHVNKRGDMDFQQHYVRAIEEYARQQF